MNFSIMNNTPFHFIIASITLLVFLGALLVNDSKLKASLTLALKILFVLVLLSGLYILTLVPITAAVIVKSLGGLVLMWAMLELIKTPSQLLYWGLFVVVAGVGLTLAFGYI
ncbi:MAG: hypothetical protein WEE20_06195 [Bacteroidota bacterium]